MIGHLLIILFICEASCLLLTSNLAIQLSTHLDIPINSLHNVSRSKLASIIESWLQKHELQELEKGAEIRFGGLTHTGANETFCAEHSLSIAAESQRMNQSLQYPKLPCIIHQEPRCNHYAGAQRTYYISLERVKLVRRFDADDDCEQQMEQMLEGVGVLKPTLPITEYLTRRNSSDLSA